MFRRLKASAIVALVLTAVAAMLFGGSAAAAGANVTITPTVAANGTTTLTYRATVTRGGTLRDIIFSIPAGSTGRITSVNGTMSTVSPGVLKWRPTKVVTVGIGARFAIPLYGLRLPSGGPWTLSFKATGTTGLVLSAGTGVLTPLKTYTPNVAITASKPIPGETTTLTYAATITKAGVLANVKMQLPPGVRGAVTSVNGTLTTSAGFATWTPRAPISVAAGARLGIPIYGVVLSKYGGVFALGVSARTSTGIVLTTGAGNLSLIAPPAAMPAVAVAGFAAVPPGCPTVWPSTTTENAKTGSGAWVIPASMNGKLAGYLSKVSATCGDTLDLKVTSGNPVSVVAYRMGYYQGLGGREVWRAEDVPTVVQPAPTTGGTANGKDLRMTTAAHWTKTLSIDIDADWIPGTYLLKISDGTFASYAPLTVRDDTGTKHDLMIQQATATWEAYNSYGGVGFYSGLTTGSGRVTSERPYNEGQGSGQFLTLEQGLVFWAESKGLDVTYWTNHDLDMLGGQLPARAGTIFLPAHDEYFSMGMRASLSQAMNRGVNVANLGANTAYRLIKFTDETRRAWDIDRYTDGYTSTTWRYLGDAYASQPLLGGEYICPVTASTLTTGTSWMFDGITPGTTLPGFVAGEIDFVWPSLYKHPGMSVIASATSACRSNGKAAPMQTTTFTMPSGARILNGSTFAYGCFLVGRCPSNWTVPAPPASSQQAAGTIVANITEWVSRGQIQVPSDTTAARMRVSVPKQKLETFNQP
ncbi:hypothetical protein GCM10009789_65930 [Kribbella sancticallisti]|uniref:N,N-dimethylformamidase beta subunit-like C-terminal domain-containing protein n=1 Tax=Kribbella sancticallisti TaxID=460087 RepID=A0ABP4Q7D4_9ACTN